MSVICMMWAEKPLVPTVKDAAWVKTPVDAFIQAKLEQNWMQHSPPAAREALIRRATYDLTGLPPTPQEVRAFVNDASPDAFARVVQVEVELTGRLIAEGGVLRERLAHDRVHIGRHRVVETGPRPRLLREADTGRPAPRRRRVLEAAGGRVRFVGLEEIGRTAFVELSTQDIVSHL